MIYEDDVSILDGLPTFHIYNGLPIGDPLEISIIDNGKTKATVNYTSKADAIAKLQSLIKRIEGLPEDIGWF